MKKIAFALAFSILCLTVAICMSPSPKGEGTYMDWGCVDAADDAWKDCHEAACKQFRADYKKHKETRDEAFDAAIRAAFRCLAAATTPAEEDICVDTAQAAIDAANQAQLLADSISYLAYGRAVSACDGAYFATIGQCCKECEIWEGWEDWR